jgi:nitroimidazol reductase NimA-like FMN-containing flavoprotein (pyridoxamine 5'-phosphate oxidase superfamily)
MGIELTPVEIDAFLAASPRGILCVARDGRPPAATPMWFAWVDGKIVMGTALASKKIAAIRKRPEVTFLVESGEHYWTLKGVRITGTCAVVDDQAEARAWQERLDRTKPMYRERLFPETLPPHLQRLYAGPRAALVITPSAIASWDFAKVRR